MYALSFPHRPTSSTSRCAAGATMPPKKKRSRRSTIVRSDPCCCRVCMDYTRCKTCMCGGDLYCGETCHLQHWPVHQRYCTARSVKSLIRLFALQCEAKLPMTLCKFINDFRAKRRNKEVGVVVSPCADGVSLC